MSYRTFRLHKLVRDKIVDFNITCGGRVEHKVLEADELRRALIAKIVEEATEMTEGVTVDELADVQEALDQLAANAGISKDSIVVAQTEKNTKNGAFKKGHFVETLTLPEGNEWIDYYAADPEKFPEVK
jgi:predicted house-cleaning noncanonical NTP pyrophosphatase (MazG superfamily)